MQTIGSLNLPFPATLAGLKQLSINNGATIRSRIRNRTRHYHSTLMVRTILYATIPARRRLKISIRTRRTAGHLSLVAKDGATRPAQLVGRVVLARKLGLTLRQTPPALKAVVKAMEELPQPAQLLQVPPPPLLHRLARKTTATILTMRCDFGNRSSPGMLTLALVSERELLEWRLMTGSGSLGGLARSGYAGHILLALDGHTPQDCNLDLTISNPCALTGPKLYSSISSVISSSFFTPYCTTVSSWGNETSASPSSFHPAQSTPAS